MKKSICILTAVITLLTAFEFCLTSSAKSSLSVSLSRTSFTYNGSVKTPSVTVKYGKSTLEEDIDYTVKYQSGRKNVGKYRVTVTTIGENPVSKTVSFKIMPRETKLKKVTGHEKSVEVVWKAHTSQVTGYKIQYSTSSSFKSYKTLTVKKASTGNTLIDGLKEKTVYYVRIRTYKKVGDSNYYSPWSEVMHAKTLKASAKSKTSTVYITPTGKCYHYSKGCAGKNAKKTTLSYAKSKYRACKKCVK